MGVVYLAEDTTLSREVALKLLYPSLSTDSAFVDRFKQEARIVASILHPNIVRINSFETIDTNLAIDMEYVPGPSLGQMMQHEVFTPQLAVQIARDALEGLAVCHELGVVHRDIKPNNILLSPEGRAKLADFGLATAYATHLESSIYRLSSSGFFMGTPRFAPPEAWEGAHPSPDWDLYSLGLVLYEGLSGKPAYDGNTPLAIVKQIMTNPVLPISECAPLASPEMAAFIDRLISHDRTQRPKDAGEALVELRKLPEFEKSVGTDSPTVRTTVRTFTRKANNLQRKVQLRKYGVRGAVAAALVATTCAALWFAFNPRVSAPSGTGTAAPTSTSQEEIGRSGLLTANDVLAHPKTNQSKKSRVFTARYFQPTASGQLPASAAKVEGGRTEHWMLTKTADNICQIVGISDRFLLKAELTETGAGNVSFTGDWASYAYDFGAGFQDGTVQGQGTWMAPDTALNVSLSFLNVRDRSVQNYGVAATIAEDVKTDSQFAYSMERATLLQPLIFTELLPRSAPWAEYVAGLLPSVYNSVCEVPLLSDPNTLTLDGRLDENIWMQKYFCKSGEMGSLIGRPSVSEAEFKARATSDALLLGLRVNRPPKGRWGVRMMLMPILSGPILRQGNVKIARYSDDKSEFHYYIDGVEAPWDASAWETALAGGDTMSCEMAVPYGLLRASAVPKEDLTWRMNAWVVEDDASASSGEKTIAAWGYPDLAAIEHGALLRFEKHAL